MVHFFAWALLDGRGAVACWRCDALLEASRRRACRSNGPRDRARLVGRELAVEVDGGGWTAPGRSTGRGGVGGEDAEGDGRDGRRSGCADGDAGGAAPGQGDEPAGIGLPLVAMDVPQR